MKTILVTGATGTQGGAVVDHLLASGDDWAIHGLTRDADSDGARELRSRGVTVVEGEMTDADRMAELVEGVDAVYCVTTFLEDGPGAETEQGVTVAEAAVDAGVDHFVYSSVSGADVDTGLAHFESKYAVEGHVADLDLPTTVVRPVFFMQNFEGPMGEGVEDGHLAMPLAEGVSLTVVDADDIGQTVLKAVNDPDRFVGETVTLAGADLTLEGFADAFGDHLGSDVAPVHLDTGEYREAAGDEMADMFQWLNDVDYDIDIAALESTYGLEMSDFEAYLGESEAWRSARTAR